MKRLWIRLFATGASLAAILGVASLSLPTPPAHAEEKTLRWILNGPALAVFATDPFTKALFANTQPFVVERKGLSVDIPASWGALKTQIFPSYRAFARAVANDKIDPLTKAILYDNEAWQFTPQEEQDDLADYAQRFADLAHQKGYLAIVTPAINLVRTKGTPGEKRFDTFLRLNVPAAAAKYADVYEIQAQGSQVPANVFASYVTMAARQARAANPKVLVLAGISTGPSGQKMSAGEIVAAINATRTVVDGYWFNVPQQSEYCPKCGEFRPDLAIDVLHQIQSRP
jgi:hypothetical protein